MNKGLLSIIIPVYNSRDRLAECFESIVNQNFQRLEVIVVDDCSSDGSLELCQEYERNYAYFHVFTKENEGVSAARNYGLARAQGEYIQFADSDDMLYPDACRHLVERMEQDASDLVICGYYNEREQKKVLPLDLLLKGREGIREQFSSLFTRFLIHVPWNKLYRRRVLEQAEAAFPLDLNKGEDLLFNLKVLEQADKISLLPEALYFYHNVNDQSLSFKFREDSMEIEERLFQNVEAFWDHCGGKPDPEFLSHFYLTAVKNKLYALVGRSGFDARTCQEYMKKWAKMKSVLRIYDRRQCFGLKDRILLYLMRRQRTRVLYLYYKWMGDRS
ncbi:MAG: glycosyltransferase [Eubacterium sp.]|nr:glycosyltransferase [Eubacterium sp.]